ADPIDSSWERLYQIKYCQSQVAVRRHFASVCHAVYPLPSRCILQYSQSIWVAVHVVVSNVKCEWDWYCGWLFFMHKWHKAPECTLIAKILKHRNPLRIKKKKKSIYNHFREIVTICKRNDPSKVLKTVIILFHFHRMAGMIIYSDVRVRPWEDWSSIGFVLSIFA
ncbi:mCG145939, partial [Mus musculus]